MNSGWQCGVELSRPNLLFIRNMFPLTNWSQLCSTDSLTQLCLSNFCSCTDVNEAKLLKCLMFTALFMKSCCITSCCSAYASHSFFDRLLQHIIINTLIPLLTQLLLVAQVQLCNRKYINLVCFQSPKCLYVIHWLTNTDRPADQPAHYNSLWGNKVCTKLYQVILKSLGCFY